MYIKLPKVFVKSGFLPIHYVVGLFLMSGSEVVEAGCIIHGRLAEAVKMKC